LILNGIIKFQLVQELLHQLTKMGMPKHKRSAIAS
jgi:hypothetical protein